MSDIKENRLDHVIILFKFHMTRFSLFMIRLFFKICDNLNNLNNVYCYNWPGVSNY